MHLRLFLGPTATTTTAVFLRRSSNHHLFLTTAPPLCYPRRRCCVQVVACAGLNGQQNHYEVLGISIDASTSDIKTAYRHLALKYHPDVNKDSQADERFKGIHRAYEVLSDDKTRNQYDRSIQVQQSIQVQRPYVSPWSSGPPWKTVDFDIEEYMKVHGWPDLKQRMTHEQYQEWRKAKGSPLYDESEEENSNRGKHSFIEVLRSAFLSVFLFKTIGAAYSLTCTSFMALIDPELDLGYKVGYVVAWVLGGKGGILLTLCLSFASWVCGKRRSNVVALVAVSMWIGSNLARFAPLPQGALLTLLYMLIKLQSDISK